MTRNIAWVGRSPANSLTTLERAFQLARTGEFAGASQIRLKLTADGYSGVNLHIAGTSLVRQLNRICRDARTVQD